MSPLVFAEGREAAELLMKHLAGASSKMRRAMLIHDTLLELIDVPLNWNSLEATVDRLAGFAEGLAEALPSSPCGEALPKVPLGMVAALWECGIAGGHAHAQ